jgi:hypothetical protein
MNGQNTTNIIQPNLILTLLTQLYTAMILSEKAVNPATLVGASHWFEQSSWSAISVILAVIAKNR